MMRHMMQTGGPAAAQAIAAAVAGGAPQADVEGITHQTGIHLMQSRKQAAHANSGILDRAVKASIVPSAARDTKPLPLTE